MAASRAWRRLLTIGGVLVLLAVAAAMVLPLFLNTAGTRARIENALGERLGRRVTLGSTRISVWTGSLVAENVSVADDPAFSREPFFQARSIRMGVDVLPFLLHRELRVRDLAIDRPKLLLLHAAGGGWNYAGLGRPRAPGPAGISRPAPRTGPTGAFTFSISEVIVRDGKITVGLGDGPARVYTRVVVRLHHPGQTDPSPFEATADLPGDGTLSLRGVAGPLSQGSARAMPWSAHFELTHVDPLAAGILPLSAGVSGLVDSLQLDAAWDGHQLHATKLLMDGPRLTLVRSDSGPGPAANGQTHKSSFLSRLWVQDAEVSNGALTVRTLGRAGAPMNYTAVHARLLNLAPGRAASFQLSAQTQGGGSLQASGNLGPFAQPGQAWTPVDAHVTLQHLRLPMAGVLPAGTGIDGLLDLQAQVATRGQTLRASGEAKIAGLRLARNGLPSPKPLDARFTMLADRGSETVQVPDATVSVGGAVLQVSGSCGLGGPSPTLNGTVKGAAMPVDAIEAFLPAVGVRLPQGSRLQGGTLTTTLAVTGTVADPVIAGPVALLDTQLAGFNLGQKLEALSRLTGGRIGGATGPGTVIRSVRMEVRDSGAGLATDHIALDVQGLGTATGEGTVSRGGALHYEMLVRLTELVGGPAQGATGGGGGLLGLLSRSGLLGSLAGGVIKRGIPVEVGGTTADPTFMPRL